MATQDEISYLSRIGSFHERVRHTTDRETLLQNYINSAKKRIDWDGMDKKAILVHAKKCLDRS